MSRQAVKVSRRLRRAWDDIVILALAVFIALIAGTLFSSMSAHAGDVAYVRAFDVVTAGNSVPTQASAMVASADGRFVFVANRLDHSLVRYRVDSAGAWSDPRVYANISGVVEPVQLMLNHGEDRLYVLGDPDGDADTLAEFAIDTTTGELSPLKLHTNGVGVLAGLATPSGIAVSKDDAYVYVTSRGDHRVLIFARQPDGTLAPAGSVRDGLDGVEGLLGAAQIVISPDGASVYVTGALDHSVAMFRRDATTGALTFLGVLADGVNGVDGLNGAWAIAISNDGAYVYVGGLGDDNAIAVFARDADTGLLTPRTVYRNGDPSGVMKLAGLSEIVALRVAPHRNHLYAVSAFESSLVVFDRNSATGELVFHSRLKQGDAAGTNTTIAGLGEPLNLSVDPQNRFLYSVGIDRRVGQFEVANAAPEAENDNVFATLGTGATPLDVLTNDTDPDAGDHLHVVRVTAPATKGQVALINGQVLYTPAASVGVVSDTFKYTVADARGAESEATVIVAINAPPVASNDWVTTKVNVPVTVYVLVNDTDANDDRLEVTGFDAVSQQRGGVEPVQSATGGNVAALTYTPPENFTGTDTFTYAVSDGKGGVATATVTVTVSDTAASLAGSSASNAKARKKGGGVIDAVTFGLLFLTLSTLCGTRRR